MISLIQPPFLKPCPFCGEEALLGYVDEEGLFSPEDDSYWVACKGCQASIGGLGDDATRETVTAQWNRRTATGVEDFPKLIADVRRIYNVATWSDTALARILNWVEKQLPGGGA